MGAFDVPGAGVELVCSALGSLAQASALQHHRGAEFSTSSAWVSLELRKCSCRQHLTGQLVLAVMALQ